MSREKVPAPDSQARHRAEILPAAAPNYTRFTNLIAETAPTHVRLDFAEV